MIAVEVREPGGPEVLTVVDRPAPVPGPGQARVRVSAIGVNFIDIQQRAGHYDRAVPFVPGGEGVGVVVHAGAGGVGMLLTQILKIRGATVISTVSTPAKAEMARTAGADHVAPYDDLQMVVERETGGVGVAAVYDAVGAATFETSLACAAAAPW